jgi:DNA replication protein
MTQISDRPPIARAFPGFPDRMELVPIPGAVLGTLLLEIDNLAELKTLLYVLRLLHDQPRNPRFVRRSHMLADAGLLAAVSVGAEKDGLAAADLLSEALSRMERRGTVLAVSVLDGAADDTCYLLNTPANEKIVQRVLTGERTLGDLGPTPVPQEPAQPKSRVNIYELYEQNIGLLTPLLAEELADALTLYPVDWIEDAFREAVAHNKRNWRYVQRILEGWDSRGRGDRGTTWRRPEAPKSPGGYLETRYGRLTPR